MKTKKKNKIKILFIGTSHSLIFKRWVEWFLKNDQFEIGIIGKVKNEFGVEKFYDIAVPKDNKYQKTYFLGYFIQIFKIKKAIKDFKPDIIHSHQSFLYGIFISILNFHPHVLTLWGSDILLWPQKSKIIRYLTIFSLKNADIITAESKYILNECKNLKINKNKLKQIQFGIDFNYFNEALNDKIDREFKLDISRDIIVFPRGLEEIYNPMLLVEAMPMVIEQSPNVLFIFKYFNRKKNDEKIHKIKKRIQHLGVSEQFYSFIGELNYNQLLKLYSLSKIVISIPSSDSTSISLIEAMIMGCVPIVSDIAANREMIDGTNGIIIPFDYKKLGDSILSILLNYSLWKDNLNNYREILLTKFDHNRNMEIMSDFYKKLVNH